MQHFSERVDLVDHQLICDVTAGVVERFSLPHWRVPVMKGIEWGRAEVLFTPAFWAAQAWFHRNSHRYRHFSWGSDLRHEIVGCLLGGHGISSEMNQAAFERLNNSGVIWKGGTVDDTELSRLLCMPFEVHGRSVRYRFARQKSRFVADALRRLQEEPAIPSSPKELRLWLLSFAGIGLKTASWITRNYLRSGAVAVLDIHIFRAGVIMGLFSEDDMIPRDYLSMEEKFLEFANRIGVAADTLDVIIWRTMRDSGRLALHVYRAAA